MEHDRRSDGEIKRTVDQSRASWTSEPTELKRRPNIVMIVLDDVGYSRLGRYGSDIETPALDSLAADGLRYANFHVAPLCSPTRTCLLTGRNSRQRRHGPGRGSGQRVPAAVAYRAAPTTVLRAPPDHHVVLLRVPPVRSSSVVHERRPDHACRSSAVVNPCPEPVAWNHPVVAVRCAYSYSRLKDSHVTFTVPSTGHCDDLDGHMHAPV